MSRRTSMLRHRLKTTRLEDRINCSTFWVTNTLDFKPNYNPIDPFNSTPIPGSLRYALRQASETPGGAEVRFNTDPNLGVDFDNPLNPQTINIPYGSLSMGVMSYIDTSSNPVYSEGNAVQIHAPRYFDQNAPHVQLQLTGTLNNDASDTATYGSDWSVIDINYIGRLSDDPMEPGYHQPNYGRVMALDGLTITGGKASNGAGISASGVFTLEISESKVVGNQTIKIGKSGTAGAGQDRVESAGGRPAHPRRDPVTPADANNCFFHP